MYAKRRKIVLRNGVELETPLLLPSFSSKTFQDERVGQILQYMAGTITDEILISAYDLFYREIRRKIKFSSAIFLDSGGYEASEDLDLSDSGKRIHRPRPWSLNHHQRVLSRWDYGVPTIIVSFDSPTSKTSAARQVERAKRLFSKFSRANSEILFKTERRSSQFLNIQAIIDQRHNLGTFDIIGVTEKELGPSTLDRMVSIAKLRLALTSAKLETPIHVFGSLDTISTPLYYFAGADIFDGLTWLRYAFADGATLYKHNYGAQRLGISFEDFRVNGKVWNDNYYYLFQLRDDMRRFLLENDFEQFKFNAPFFKSACAQFRERMQEH